jgi:hypothetical protein
MSSVWPFLTYLLLIFSGWLNRRQLIVIEFLEVENRLLKERLRGKRIPFTEFIDLMSGVIPVMFANPTSVMPFVKSGKIKLLATASSSCVRTLPDLPTVAETVSGYEHGNSSGFMVRLECPMLSPLF